MEKEYLDRGHLAIFSLENALLNALEHAQSRYLKIFLQRERIKVIKRTYLPFSGKKKLRKRGRWDIHYPNDLNFILTTRSSRNISAAVIAQFLPGKKKECTAERR